MSCPDHLLELESLRSQVVELSRILAERQQAITAECRRFEKLVESCRDSLVRYPATRIIFLTSFAADESVLVAALAGVQGYILKNIDSSLLVVDRFMLIARGNRCSIQPSPNGC